MNRKQRFQIAFGILFFMALFMAVGAALNSAYYHNERTEWYLEKSSTLDSLHKFAEINMNETDSLLKEARLFLLKK